MSQLLKVACFFYIRFDFKRKTIYDGENKTEAQQISNKKFSFGVQEAIAGNHQKQAIAPSHRAAHPWR